MNFLFSHSKLSSMMRSLLQPRWFAGGGLLLEPALTPFSSGDPLSGHSLKVTWWGALMLPIKNNAVLRNTFSAGISVWSCCASRRLSSGSRSWDKRLWTANSLQNKGRGDLWCSQGMGHSEAQQDLRTSDIVSLRLHGCKSPVVPLFGALPWKHLAQPVISLLYHD